MNRNYANTCNAILDVCNLIGEPLNEAQRMTLAGAMTIWLKKERSDALNEAANICEGIAGCAYAGQAPSLRDVAKAIRNRP